MNYDSGLGYLKIINQQRKRNGLEVLGLIYWHGKMQDWWLQSTMVEPREKNCDTSLVDEIITTYNISFTN